MKTQKPCIRWPLLLALCELTIPAPAAVVNWTNTNGGLWSAATNWSGGIVPATGNDVFITNAGTYTVTQDVHVTIASLTLGSGSGTQTLTNAVADLTLSGASTVNASGVFGLGGGALAGTGALTVGGKAVWSGGTIAGVVTVATNGALTIGGLGTKFLTGVGTLINHGSMAWTGLNDIQTWNSARIVNQPGALFDIQNNQLLSIYNGGAITNLGTLRKSAGGGSTLITVPVYNHGTLDVQSGSVAYGAANHFNDGTALTGAGTNRVYAGTITFNGGIYSTNLEIAGATIAGHGVFSGTVNWTSGDLTSGTLTVATNGVLNIRGATIKSVNGTGTLINYGSVVWSGTNDIQTGNSARIINQSGALFDIQNNQLLSIGNGGVITNLGTLRKSAGGGNTIITVPLYNSGLLDVQSGSIAYGAANHFNDGTAFTGAGTNRVYAGLVTFNGAIASENLEIGGSTIVGNATFSGVVNWSSGDWGDSTLAIATNGVLNICGSAGKHLGGTAKLVNYGSVVWSGTNDIGTANYARIINQLGAVFDIQNNQLLSIGNGGAITNFGTIRKSAGGGSSVITVPVYNHGTLDVQSGAIGYGASVGNQFNDGTTFSGAGTNLIYAGTVTFNDAISSENLELGGATIVGNGRFSGIVNWTSGDLHDGTQTIATNGVLNIKGLGTKNLWGTGTLINYGLIAWSGSNDLNTLNSSRIINQPGALFDIQNNQSLTIWNGGAITNLGTFRKSSGGQNSFIEVPFRNFGAVEVQGGTITFQTYTQTGGKLSFGLNSLTNFGRLAFNNSIAFNGTLGVNLNGGYAPVAGDAFALITYPSRTGTFADFDLPASHAWQTTNGTTTLTLTVLNARPTVSPVSDKTTDEQELLSFSVTGSDPDTGQSLTYALLDPPGGATINTNTGLFSWTPDEAQGPAINVIAVQITDNGTPSLSATQQFSVVINEVNRAPTVLVPVTQTCDEMAMLTVTNSATDPDLPANSFHYRLVSAPSGVELDPDTGALTWTPTEAQGPFTNTIKVAVTDNGTSPLSDTNDFTVIVREVNRAPVLTPLANCTHVPGAICWITNSASDPDQPAGQLTFSLLNAPPGMSIGPSSGLMIWGPPANCATLTNTVTVRVSDNGSPALTNEQTFVSTLISIPSLRIAHAGAASVVLSWPADATAAGFVLQSTTNPFAAETWANAVGTPAVVAGENRLTNAASSTLRAYRLASPLAPLPTLRIATSTTNTAIVTWPTNAASFVLQTAPNLQASAVWSDATDIVSTIGDVNFITDPIANAQRCYRLRLIGPP